MVTDESQWYVQKGSRVQGPFSCDEVGRFLLLGRVRNTDRVSKDGELWEPVTQVPELIPEALLDLESGSGWRRFLDVRAASDERDPAAQVAVEPDQRDPQADPLQQARLDWTGSAHAKAGSDDLRSSGLQPASGGGLLPWTLLGITLLALSVTVWLNASVPAG